MMKASPFGLVMATGGIYTSYFIYGIFQEKITTTMFDNGDSREKFTMPLFLLWVQIWFNAAFAYGALRVTRAPPDETPKSTYAQMSAAYICAMWLSNFALVYIDYPTQALGKACKPVAVIVVITVLLRRRYPLFKYIVVVLITSGVAIFSLYKVQGKVADSLDPNELFYGRVLIGLSLVADGVTSALQERVATLKSSTNSFHLMLACNQWAGTATATQFKAAACCLYLSIAVVLSGELTTGASFSLRHPQLWHWLVAFSLSSAFGQMFIYWTIRTYSSLVCSIVTTTRKFFTLVISVFVFGHQLVWQQWLSILLVFGGLLGDVYMSSQRRQVKKDAD